MENRIDILNELKGLSPVIAGLEKVNVFTVPEGYFEYLCNGIMTGIEIEKGLNNDISPIVMSQAVPQGYFDTLAGNVLNKIKSQEAEDSSGELRALSPVLYSIQNENVFELPRGYFDTLTDAVLQKINAAGEEVALGELRALSPMLYSIQNENVFEVPQGYFEHLSEDILNKLIPRQATVIIMRKRSSTFFKYAVAAAFTGIMALGVIKFTGGTGDRVDAVTAQGIRIAKENKFDEELSKITDTEIVKYLETNGIDVNAALVANSVDGNELPNQADYLMDEKALDNYLNNINVKDLSN